MALYYLNNNQQLNGDYEVHTSSCSFLPAQQNREYLGEFAYCWQAVDKAKRRYPLRYRINGCFYCSFACHTS